jgi:hypothetical protein
LLMKRGVLEEETAWHTFYWPMVNYWQAATNYVHAIQEEGSLPWASLRLEIERLQVIEARKRGRKLHEVRQ